MFGASPSQVARFIPVLIAIYLLALPTFAKYGGGSGTAQDPYQIATAADLIALGETPADYDKHFILTADLDLDPKLPGRKVFDKAVIAPDTDPGNYKFSGPAFNGVFDGRGRKISHLTITGGNYQGLFGLLGWRAKIRDLGMVEVNVTGSVVCAGGLAGENSGGIVTRCYSTGAVKGNSHVGGLVGLNWGTITSCYSTSLVSGKSQVGGLVGQNVGTVGTVRSCYSTGPVSGDSSVGGLVGYNDYLVRDSVWDMETSGVLRSSGGVGLTTAAMRDAYMLGLNGFANDPNWVLDPGRDYPRLSWEGKPGDIIPEPSIDWLEGDGTAEKPYRIDTAEQLIFLGRASVVCDKHLVLEADVDLDPDIVDGQVFPQAVIPTLTGVFDGKGHRISHLTIMGDNGLGLFGELGSGAEVRNLGLVDISIAGSGLFVGGLVGHSRGTVTSCYSTGMVSGEYYVGGLVGWDLGGSTIIYCYSTGVVSGEYHVGGLVGSNQDSGTVTQCYSTGGVSGTESVGGLVGGGGFVTQCYSTGVVTSPGRSVGGLLGHGYGARASFWDTQTSGQATSPSGEGKTTPEMQTAATFLWAGWYPCGEAAIWTIDEGRDYPRLWWENRPGQPLVPVSLSEFMSGAGTADDPYLIYTVEELNRIGLKLCEWDKHFKLMADIDLSGLQGASFNMIGSIYVTFTGVFDGKGHTISHLTIKREGEAGMFGWAAGEIKNLGVLDVNITGSGYYVGGLVGYSRGTITSCYSTGAVRGNSYVGGLVGGNSTDCSVVQCYSTCAVGGGSDVGGLVGSNDGDVIQCYSTGPVSGNKCVAGLVGYNWQNGGTITYCYSTSTVNGRDQVGGLVGVNGGHEELTRSVRAHVSQCYSAGSVHGDSNVGGLVGTNKGAVSYCLWDIQTSGQAESAGGTGKTTFEIQDPNTLVAEGWDLLGHGIWVQPQDSGYPILWWQLAPGPSKPSFSGGVGEPNDPYLVSTAEELNSISRNPMLMKCHFKLINDLDLTRFRFYCIGDYHYPYAGVFDGNGHVISGLTLAGTSYLGLFGALSGKVEDLGTVDVNVAGGSYVGGVVGYNTDSGRVTRCYTTGAVSGTERVGGLVGYNIGTLTNCYSTAVVSGSASVGGLLGVNGTWRYAADERVRGRVSHCYSAGSVTGKDQVGGLVGSNIGAGSWQPLVAASFWDTKTSAQDTSVGGTGKTTAEMQTAKTFLDAGWDFVGETANGTGDIWWILEGKGYPRLWWELIPAK